MKVDLIKLTQDILEDRPLTLDETAKVLGSNPPKKMTPAQAAAEIAKASKAKKPRAKKKGLAEYSDDKLLELVYDGPRNNKFEKEYNKIHRAVIKEWGKPEEEGGEEGNSEEDINREADDRWIEWMRKNADAEEVGAMMSYHVKEDKNVDAQQTSNKETGRSETPPDSSNEPAKQVEDKPVG
jgi:hypothetical protein